MKWVFRVSSGASSRQDACAPGDGLRKVLVKGWDSFVCQVAGNQSQKVAGNGLWQWNSFVRTCELLNRRQACQFQAQKYVDCL